MIAFTGDGGFLINGQALAAVLQYGDNIVIVLFSNRMHCAIRLHQENNYPARVWETELVHPDSAAYARALGAHDEVVEAAIKDFAPAPKRSLNAGRPALIEVRLVPEALSPRRRLSELRAKTLNRLSR